MTQYGKIDTLCGIQCCHHNFKTNNGFDGQLELSFQLISHKRCDYTVRVITDGLVVREMDS